MSYLLTRGVQLSISSDDPAFFGYEGVTLDYVYATGAWSLDLRDLKKLSLNGIKYSSISEEEKVKMTKEVFEPAWKAWINQLNSG